MQPVRNRIIVPLLAAFCMLFFCCGQQAGTATVAVGAGSANQDSETLFIDTSQADVAEWEGVRKMGEAEFKQSVLKTTGITVVDFSAEWCRPCRQLQPILASIATQYAGKVRFANIDVDENTSLAVSLSITSIPFIAYYKAGQLVDKEVGLRSEKDLKDKIEGLMETQNPQTP